MLYTNTAVNNRTKLLSMHGCWFNVYLWPTSEKTHCQLIANSLPTHYQPAFQAFDRLEETIFFSRKNDCCDIFK